jgi:hypothetical protein
MRLLLVVTAAVVTPLAVGGSGSGMGSEGSNARARLALGGGGGGGPPVFGAQTKADTHVVPFSAFFL